MMVNSNVRTSPGKIVVYISLLWLLNIVSIIEGVCIPHPDMTELPAILFSLILENPEISYWAFYIEKEFNCVRKQRAYVRKFCKAQTG